jgi:hypothetical protein
MFDILQYVAIKMKQLGVKSYTCKPVYFKDLAAQSLNLNANNEYYLLLNATFAVGLTIFSSDEFINFPNPAEYQNHVAYRYQIFTGQIQVSQLANIDVEFLRIVPDGEQDISKEEILRRREILMQELKELLQTDKKTDN